MTSNSQARVGRSLLIGLLLAGSTGTLYLGLRIGIADLLAVSTRWEMSQWFALPGGMPSEARWAAAHEAYSSALAITPHDPQLHESLGYLQSLQANRFSTPPDVRQNALKEALAANRRAAEYRPMSPHSWSNIAFLSHQMGEGGPALWDAYDRAMRYGWRQVAIRVRLAEIGFARWDGAGPERQAQLNQLIVSLPTSQRQEIVLVAIRYGRYHWLSL